MSFTVTILGSNSALPTSERNPTAQILNVSERFFLIDCGEGTQMQLRKFKCNFSKINHIFISHLHGDHVFGLMGLISTMGLLGRKADLHVFAHADLSKLYSPLLNYFCNDLTFQVVFHPIDSKSRSVIYEDDKVSVTTLPLKHRIPTTGFLFVEKMGYPNIRKDCIAKYDLSIAEIVKIKEGGDLRLESGEIIPTQQLVHQQPKPRSYAFCSDTKYFAGLSEMIQDVSLLYHESTFLNEDKELAKKTTHSTAEQAAQVALQAKAKKLIIGHFSSRYRNLDLFLNEARQVFTNTDLATEGQVFEIVAETLAD